MSFLSRVRTWLANTAVLPGGRGMFQGGIYSEIPSRPHVTSLASEYRKIAAIEELLGQAPHRLIAERLLLPYLDEEDPWIRARAAKALAVGPFQRGREELHKLVAHPAREARLAGLWGWAELPAEEALGVMGALAWDKDREVQQATIRCLIQMEERQGLSQATLDKIRRLLGELRDKTDWIV